MTTLVSLIVSIAPLVFLAALSPVVFINGTTSVTTGGQRGGWAFAAGNAVVIVPVGFAFFGVLGTSAADFAERQFASAVVDRFLALIMFGFAGYLAWTQWGSGKPHELGGRPAPRQPKAGALFGWGVLGQVTNLTTLPFLAALSQRIGASALPLIVRLGVLLVSMAVTLIASWSPAVLARFAPHWTGVSDEMRVKIAGWMSLISVVALVIGGIVLFAQSF